MNYKKIFLGFTLAVACWSSQNAFAETSHKYNKTSYSNREVAVKSKKTETQAASTNVYWTDGNSRVSYNVIGNISPVVKIALDMFEGDMRAVTGLQPKLKSGAPIQIYQLDALSNKEFSAVEKLGAPLHKIITTHDAYYIGTRNNKVIVVGSDARGTAYAIMQLSQIAGVSPWAAWNDLQPQTRRTLYIPAGKEWIEMPRIEYRGLALNGSQWMKPQNFSQLARLMLRLKANTLWQVDGKHTAAYNKAVVDSFDICIADNYKVTELVGKKHKKHKKHKKKTLENVKMLFDDDQMQLHCVSPGLLLEALNNRDYIETKGSHHDKASSKSHRQEMHADEDCAWIANVTNPKLCMLQLGMMMDAAWKVDALKQGSKLYLQDWLSAQFGEAMGKRIAPVMEQYYRLTSIRQPAYMSLPYGDTEFHSGEFGNELERYLYAFDQLKAKVESIERNLPANQKDGFFEVVKYPIFSAALIAEKELEAQEARHIARPGLFNNDNEAKAAAAVSLTAYEKLKQLNGQYLAIKKGKWRPMLVINGGEMQAPTLPGTLSASDVVKYRREAFDRTEDLKSLSLSTSDIIAKNAWEWTTTTPAPAVKGKLYESITLVPLLGHSNQAVKLPKGATLNYTFYSNQSGDARFTIAAIPSYMMDAAGAQNMRVSVSIDHAAPVVCQLKEQYNSKQWKLDLWRGQALKSFYVTLPSGNHSIEIKALDEHVILDQWVLDYDVDREYYVFPVGK